MDGSGRLRGRKVSAPVAVLIARLHGPMCPKAVKRWVPYWMVTDGTISPGIVWSYRKRGGP